MQLNSDARTAETCLVKPHFGQAVSVGFEDSIAKREANVKQALDFHDAVCYNFL